MVPKESGFNQPETASANVGAECDVFHAHLPREGMVKLYKVTKAAFLSSRRHNLPSKLKLCNNQTVRNAVRANIARWQHC